MLTVEEFKHTKEHTVPDRNTHTQYTMDGLFTYIHTHMMHSHPYRTEREKKHWGSSLSILECIWKQAHEKWLLPDSWKHFQWSGKLLLGFGTGPGTLGLYSCLAVFKSSIWCPTSIVSQTKYPPFSSGESSLF